MSNHGEYVAGTDPRKRSLVQELCGIERVPEHGAWIKWKSVTNRWCAVGRSSNLNA